MGVGGGKILDRYSPKGYIGVAISLRRWYFTIGLDQIGSDEIRLDDGFLGDPKIYLVL